VRPALGRLISPDDDRTPGAHPVTVVSHAYWQKRLGGNQSVIGNEALVNGRSYTIIGVAPQGFFGTEIIAAPEMWFPMSMQAQIEVGDEWLDERGTENIFVQGRLKPGVSLAQAQKATNLIAAQLEREYPEKNEGKRSAPRAMTSRVSPGYFQAMKTRLTAGREFTERDDEQEAHRYSAIPIEFQSLWPREDEARRLCAVAQSNLQRYSLTAGYLLAALFGCQHG
jgi:hypothetical protein